MPTKTRPIGHGVRNITVTLAIPEVLDVERQARASGVDRSPYIRTLVQWGLEHGVLVRPEAVSYKAYLTALEHSVSPLPKIKYEVVLTKLGPPLQVLLATNEKPIPPEHQIVYVADFDSLRVAEDPPGSPRAGGKEAGGSADQKAFRKRNRA